jgi:acetoin utilization deacetylase AcuC-like enzyme
MRAYYSSTFVPQLPVGHHFPARKYARLHERVLSDGILSPADLHEAEPASDAQILAVHAPEYWHKVVHGTLTEREQRRIGFPWSPQIRERTRRVSGGTIAACRAALREGVSVNLAGGTHHAHRDFGSGFCILNDCAIAARAMQGEGLARRIVIIDCDVHQGDGTAALMRDDPSVFTFSIHGEKNFPFHKQRSSLDIELKDGTEDALYLDLVEEGVRRSLAYANADLALYIAGADPYVDDRLGRMAVTMAGLAERDRIVFDLCRAEGLPVAVVMGGGYARSVEDIATIHAQTVRSAVELARG